ncbi:hypothetical protein FOL46_008010 [Perkinsus olseni]|uniref:POC1 centriolar protein A n=1 Tax=Perkinsus olseni TaxID=32597 RepID=A0A7J6LA55_PEROL|nr:hypothetical protein FOL46_008010 [Perkinsus olseni]
MSAADCGSASVPINPGLSIARVFKGHKGPVTRAVPVPSGGAGFSQYASSGGDSSVIIWSTKHNTRPLRCEGHSDRVTAVAADASGRWIASAGVDKTDLMLTCSDDKTVKLWKMPVGGDRKSSNLQDRKFLCSLVGHSNWVLTCAFSADAASAVSGGEDRTVRVWDIETKTNFACFYDNTLSVRSVTFSPVTPQLVGAAGDDGSINFWDTRLPTGKQLVQRYSPAHDRGSVLSIALRPDNGHLLASGGRQGDIRLWDLREGRRIACVAQGKAEAAARLPPVNSVRWCQDVNGRYELIIGSADGQVYIWDIEDSIVLPMRAPTPVLADPRPSEGPSRGYATSPAPVAFTRSEAAAAMSRTLDLGSVTTEAVPKAMEAVGDQLLVIQRTMELIEKRVQLMEDKVANLELNLRAPQSPLKLENMPRDANQAVPDETTGANKGIGFEVCKRLIGEGVRVIMTARDEERLKPASDILKPYAAVQLDVADDASIGAGKSQIARLTPSIDALINNAAVLLDEDDSKPSFDRARLTIEVNLYGCMKVTEALKPMMAGKGRVVNVGSGLGNLSQVSEALQGRPASKNCTVREIMEIGNEYLEAVKGGRLAEAGFADGMYGSSKLLLIAWTKALAREAMEDPRRILVTSCTPGYCATDMTKYRGDRSAAEGAEVISWLAVECEYDTTMSGKMYKDKQEKEW